MALRRSETSVVTQTNKRQDHSTERCLQVSRLWSWFPGVRDVDFYDRLVRALDLLERFAGPGFRGWEQGELWALLGTPGRSSWPDRIDARTWPARVGRMLAPDEPSRGERQAVELRSVLVSLGLAPITDDLGKKAREDRIKYLAEHDHIRRVPGRRWINNPIRRLDHVLRDPQRRARLVNNPLTAQVTPVYVVGLRDDLTRDESQLVARVGDRIEELLAVLAYIQGYDKTGLEPRERPQASNRRPSWGTPRLGEDSVFGVTTRAFGRVSRPGSWPTDGAYLEQVRSLVARLSVVEAEDDAPSGEGE
jgi:hypothetical protein